MVKRKASFSFEEKIEKAAEEAAESFRQNAAMRKAAADVCNFGDDYYRVAGQASED